MEVERHAPTVATVRRACMREARRSRPDRGVTGSRPRVRGGVPEPNRSLIADSIAPQRLHRRRVGGAHLVMVLAALLGLVLTLTALRETRTGYRIAVAARDLAPGSALRRSDLRFESVQANRSLIDHLVRGDDLRRLGDDILTVSVRAGAPVPASALRPRAATDGRRAMSVAVERSRAVNGRLAAGDRVDVVIAEDGVAAIAAAGLEVLDVDDGDGGAFGARRGEIVITLAVDAHDSQVLASALAGGEFVLTRVTGASPAVATAPSPVPSPTS